MGGRLTAPRLDDHGTAWRYRQGCRCGSCRLDHITACQRHKAIARPRVRHELLADGHLVTYPLRYVGPRWRCCGGRVVEGARCPACGTPAPWSGHGG